MAKSILYCRCLHIEDVKQEAKDLLESTLKSGENDLFIVDDLCGLAAAEESELIEFAHKKDLTVIACHPRAVKWLLARTGIPIDILNSIHYININQTPIIDVLEILSYYLSDELKDKLSEIQKKSPISQVNEKTIDNAQTERDLAIHSSENWAILRILMINLKRLKFARTCP